MSNDHTSNNAGHSHGVGIQLPAEATAILERGLAELGRMAAGLDFQPLPGETYPLPLARAVYKQVPKVADVLRDVAARAASDPVSVLESALVLVEAYESNQADTQPLVPEDMPFVRQCFSSKRMNGWVAMLGDGDRGAIEAAIAERWSFRNIESPARATGVYVLLNMLARYSFIYGRIASGDVHAMSHFVEDHCPGVLVCNGKMSDLELTLSLAAMKMGVPAVVGPDYPFALGRKLVADTAEEVAEMIVGFANIRRMLPMPDAPVYPEYCDAENKKQKFDAAVTWGGSAESFFVVRKGSVAERGVTVVGEATGPLGVTVMIDDEPLDAFDRNFIELTIVRTLSMVDGVSVRVVDGGFALPMAREGAIDGERIGEVLIAAVGNEFPKLKKVHVEVNFDESCLASLAAEVRQEKAGRQAEMDGATEESIERFTVCVACSPFAPDHVCVLTPERRPQCGRPYEMIKTGALYGYDDMSNIHHSQLHRDINSFGVSEKGKCLDPVAGEWEGVNATVSRLSQGRTTRVQLHSLDTVPHTGCGCFRMIMFKTDAPREGIGIMAVGYEGVAADGRSWRDLHYALAGKQAIGIAGMSPGYLTSPKFLQAHGGWDSVVWVSPKVAEVMGDAMSKGVEVGAEV